MEESLRKLTIELGADFYGVADLAPAREAVREQGGDDIALYPFAVSVGIALPNSIVDQLPRRSERAVTVNYYLHCYDVINQRLDIITSRLAGFLQHEGYGALPLPASKRVDDERICASFSHKLAAHLAGLGWIGKSCLLVTPEVGPRVRWSTVLTDAPLHPTGASMEERCGDCAECVDICPQQAFTGRHFLTDEPREARYDARKCERYLQVKGSAAGRVACGLCIYVCPYGRVGSGAGD
jgi:epoxyqueuosine reductase